MDEPRLKAADKIRPPFPLGQFPEKVVRSIAKDLILSLYIKGTDQFEGSEWEKSFAKAIGAEWRPSNIGLDDVQLGSCCWGAKTVKCLKPFEVGAVRLISGRNSLDYSFNQSDVRNVDPAKVGEMILSIWNTRVSEVRTRFAHARTVVLLKGPGLRQCALFEFETLRFEPEMFIWTWNRNRNLEGRERLTDTHKFTWQPHGSQFTVKEVVPESKMMFEIVPPPPLSPEGEEALLDSLGFDSSWIKIHKP